MLLDCFENKVWGVFAEGEDLDEYVGSFMEYIYSVLEMSQYKRLKFFYLPSHGLILMSGHYCGCWMQHSCQRISRPTLKKM